MALENHSDFRIASEASKNRKKKNKAPRAPEGAWKETWSRLLRRRGPEPERPAPDQPSASDSWAS